MELDELVGEIRREAARRRAAPDFPLEREAAIETHLDALGPAGVGRSGADLARILARLRQLADPAQQASAAELASLTASAVNALAARVDHLRRWDGRPPVAPGDGGAGVVPAVVDALLGSAGPVLVIGPGASAWVAALGDRGVDASGVDPSRPEFADSGAVRAGPVSEHLASVGDGALAAVVVVGPVPLRPDHYFHFCAELARVAGRITVCSEAPWAWRVRLGDAAADLEPARPLSPETWLDGLARAGLVASGTYAPDGRSYWLQASAPVA